MIATKSFSLPTLRIVVLAAGFSSRLGQSKALARVRGTTLLTRTVGVLAPFAGGSKILVVVPPGAARYRIGPHAPLVSFIVNPRRAAGLSSSVGYGIDRARRSSGVLLLPVDLVDLQPRDIARLVMRWRGARRKVVARRTRDGAGTPLILPPWLYGRVAGLSGDQGLRDVVRRLPDGVLRMRLPSAGADVDTPPDLERARRRVRTPPPRF